MRLSLMISRRKRELRTSDPRSRDRIRHRLNVLLVVRMLRKKSKIA